MIPVKLEAVDSTAVEPVAEFMYLGSNITRDEDTMKKVQVHNGMAGVVFATLDKVWDSSIVALKLKSGLFWSLVVPVLLCNAECWPMLKNNTDAVKGFIYRCCLRRVTRIEQGSPDPFEDQAVTQEFGVTASQHAEELVKEKQLRWMGHCLRMKQDPLRE